MVCIRDGKIVNREPNCLKSEAVEQPYLKKRVSKTVYSYNPKYGDERVCKCGHLYYRHFDTYEKMSAIGCKYCGCTDFKEKR